MCSGDLLPTTQASIRSCGAEIAVNMRQVDLYNE